ncbi:MAG: hypothetical protein K0R27_1501 [Xanthobacteraceae bacterium]|jgi:transcriptional regulator with XRE-family HTH domain|nr:hypothetical protein [Xanthobacteraceae bacterium]
MTPEQFREWRAYMGYTLREAAEALDLSSGAVQSYEAGARPEGRRVVIPRTVELACAALAVGIRKYWSPQAPVSSVGGRELAPLTTMACTTSSVFGPGAGGNSLRIEAGEAPPRGG